MASLRRSPKRAWKKMSIDFTYFYRGYLSNIEFRLALCNRYVVQHKRKHRKKIDPSRVGICRSIDELELSLDIVLG